MNYKSFNVRITFQAILIGLTSAAFFYTQALENMLVTHATLGVAWILQIFYLIHYVKQTQRDLVLFFESIHYKDESMQFNERNNVAFKPLYQEFNRIIEEFKNARIETEIEHLYFQNTIKHVATGVISFDEKGRIDIFNDAAQNLLKLPQIKKISELNQVQNGFANLISNLEAGEQKLVKIQSQHELLSLSMKVAEFKLKKKHIKLVALQNIRQELDEGEIEAWQKLIRLLTHEIINSVSPITLLSTTLLNLFEKEQNNQFEAGTLDNAVEGLQAIQKRSQGLKKFVENYKSLTKIPQPQFSTFDVYDLFAQIHILFKKELEAKNISFSFQIYPKNLQLTADERLIEQVMINLVKNAIQAIGDTDNPIITLYAFIADNHLQIEVTDNGKGISEEEMENIFVPFFTTKEEGSGIGLSFSRQVMRLHKGNLIAKSKKGETVFSLWF